MLDTILNLILILMVYHKAVLVLMQCRIEIVGLGVMQVTYLMQSHQQVRKIWVVYMSSSFRLLALGSRDLFQAEKEKNVC